MIVEALRSGVPSDAELARCAQAGDGAALGLLIERHQAGMRTVALGIVGVGADVEDAVQDAALVAVRRIGELRDPAAVGGWLRAITRNCCLMQLRSRHEVPLGSDLPLASAELVPEQIVERHALRDWIWQAIEELPPALRLPVMLRYFSDASSYQEIAAVCEVPVGTVRSRLHQGRARLNSALQQSADAAHPDAGSLVAESRSEANELLAAADRGRVIAAMAGRWAPDLDFVTVAGRYDRHYLTDTMEYEFGMGIRQHLVNAVPSRDLMIWEMSISNPPEAPYHCPPGVLWVMSLRSGRICRLRLFHPPRVPPHPT